MILRNFLFLFAGLACAALSQERYADWRYSRPVSINAPALALKGNVASFPLLVRLHAGNFDFGAAQPDGHDVRFTLDDGLTRIPHEIERWDAHKRQAEVWVLVDTIRSDASTVLRMYWGNPDAPDSSNGGAVFDTANGFKAVWHMNASSGNESDATRNGFTMTAGNAPGAATGAVGLARSFNGGNQYFVANSPSTHNNAATNFGATEPHTLSAWVYADSINPVANSGNSIVNKGDNQYALQIYGTSANATGKRWESAVYAATWRQMPSKSATPAAARAWHHVTGTWGGSTDSVARIYVNGVLDSAATMTLGMPSQIQSYDVFIGVNPNISGSSGQVAPANPGSGPSKRWWWGLIDEVTISGGVRSSDWTRLAYESQKPGATLVSFGEPIGGMRLGGPKVGKDWDFDFESGIHYARGLSLNGTHDSARFVAGGYGSDSMSLDRHDLFANPSHRVTVKPDSIVLLEYSASFENPDPAHLARTALSAHQVETPILAAGEIVSRSLIAENFSITGAATHDSSAGVVWTSEFTGNHYDGIRQKKTDANGSSLESNLGPSELKLGWNNADYSMGGSYGVDFTPFELNMRHYWDSVGGSIEASTQITPWEVNARTIHANDISAEAILSGVVSATKVTADSIQASSVVTTPKWRVPDYVFEPGYARRSLSDVESFVRANRHLPDVPSAGDIAASGLDLAEMSLRLLKSIEELTLHVIDLDKKNGRLMVEVESLRAGGIEGRGGRP